MTPSTTPTETLVRIPFDGLTDFQPLALAPGLPMLDASKLTYQVLLGWFGNLLAEPELDDKGVTFHAQMNSRRQLILERALATREDLDGPLRPEFERLKKELFEVRPVSPSERLIFNRLQPPIGNHDGFLYKVRTENGGEQLVWCWGFQRRTQYGDARLCNNPDCSMLFLHDELAEQHCPHCGTALGSNIAGKEPARSQLLRSKKATAAAALIALAGGTLWIGSHFSNLSADTVLEVADTEPGHASNADLETTPYDDSVSAKDSPTASNSATDNAKKITSPGKANHKEHAASEPELLITFNNLPDVNTRDQELHADSIDSEITTPNETVPPVVSLPALPEPFTADSEPVKQDDAFPVVKADTFPQEKGTSVPGLPDVLPEPLTAQKGSEKSTPEPVTALLDDQSGSKSDTEPNSRPDIPRPNVSESDSSITLSDPLETSTSTANIAKAKSASPEKILEELPWHNDYLTAYQEASQEKRYLLMLFRESVVDGEPLTPTNSFFAPSMRPLLEQFSRVALPLNAAMPATSERDDTTEAELPNLLLEHRSFRHLGVRPGIAIVDLTDPESANHARVVSALPLPEAGLFGNDDLMLSLKLPKGNISQRTLLFAIRHTVPDSSLSMRQFSPTLAELAHRNCRFMANSGQAGNFDQDYRQRKIAEEFGSQAELKQLLFATDAETTIHDAALQAVTQWISTSESFDVLDAPAKSMGMDMFQSSETGRWFVTCFVIR